MFRPATPTADADGHEPDRPDQRQRTEADQTDVGRMGGSPKPGVRRAERNDARGPTDPSG
jgi:hypothetical protein